MRQAIAEAEQESSRTATYLFWRTEQILEAAHGRGAVELPSQRSLYRLLDKLSAGKHTTGSARTRRSLADRPDGPFSETDAWAPGEVMQMDSTPLDVLVRLDDGVDRPGRPDRHDRRRDQDRDGGGAAAHNQVGGRQRAAGPHCHPRADAARLGGRAGDVAFGAALAEAAGHRRPPGTRRRPAGHHPRDHRRGPGEGVRLPQLPGLLQLPGHQFPARSRERRAGKRATSSGCWGQ